MTRARAPRGQGWPVRAERSVPRSSILDGDRWPRATQIYAITVIGSLAGALGAFLVKRGEELDAAAKPV